MIVRKFEGQTIDHALSQVKRHLGEDAVILHTKTYRKGQVFGFLGKQMVEITASAGEKAKPREMSIAPQPTTSVATPLEKKHEPKQELDALKVDLEEIKKTLGTLVKKVGSLHTSRFQEPFQSFYQNLVAQDVSEELSAQVVEGFKQFLSKTTPPPGQEIELVFEMFLKEMMSRSMPIQLSQQQCKTVLFVGPTGVGKTTTIAKLAAHYLLQEHRNIAMMTLDTYRIAAVDQLKTYAEIMQIPIDVAVSSNELKLGIQRHAEKDLVLIDTAGRSHRNMMKMLELSNLIKFTQPDEVHLVLSASSNRRAVIEILTQFEQVRFDKLIFTKTDEAPTSGIIFETMCLTNKPVAYVTHGQNVPDDIDYFDSGRFARTLMKGESFVRPGIKTQKAY